MHIIEQCLVPSPESKVVVYKSDKAASIVNLIERVSSLMTIIVANTKEVDPNSLTGTLLSSAYSIINK